MKLLLSHVADLDGVTPVILSNLIGLDFEYELFDLNELNEFIDNKLDSNYFDKYDDIIITDLSVSKSVADKIVGSIYKDKFRLFDHHESAIYLNDYDFAYVCESINGYKECGTTLYYNYLIKNYDSDILKKESVVTFVELVRECDTWQFTDLKNEALDLNSLHAFFGNDALIDNYTEFLKSNNSFYYTKMENTILKSLNLKKQEYIESMKDKVIIKKINNYNIGFVFAELYRSELGHYICEQYMDKIDFVCIINLNYHISFRGIKDMEINKFAEIYGGGGHPKACAMPLPSGLKEVIIEYIFGDENDNR